MFFCPHKMKMNYYLLVFGTIWNTWDFFYVLQPPPPPFPPFGLGQKFPCFLVWKASFREKSNLSSKANCSMVLPFWWSSVWVIFNIGCLPFRLNVRVLKITRLRPVAIAIILSDIALILLLCIQYIHSIAFIELYS